MKKVARKARCRNDKKPRRSDTQPQREDDQSRAPTDSSKKVTKRGGNEKVPTHNQHTAEKHAEAEGVPKSKRISRTAR